MTGASRTGPGRSARWAARAAILCLIGAVVVAAVAIAHASLWQLLLAPVAIAAFIAGSWYALARRGAPRLAGSVVALAGLGAFIGVTVTAEYNGLALAAVLVLAAASSVSTRYALSVPDDGPEPDIRPPRTSSAMVEHSVLIMNPKSGGGKVERFRLPDECRDRGIEPVILEPGDDLRSLAIAAITRGASLIGMAGGDGSQALVASVAAQHDVPYVCIPAGTRNHLALDLGIDRDDVVGALDAFVDGVERKVDLATVNGRVFVNNASMGLYAKIVQSEAYREAKMKTAADMLPDLLGPETQPFDLRFTGPDGADWPYAHMLLVSNNPYELDHLLGGGKRPRMNTGKLGVAAARIEGSGAAVAFIGLEAAGRVRRFSGWAEWETPIFTVESDGPVEIGIDGEAMRMDPPLVFQSLPQALRVRLPKHARRSRAPSRSVHLTPSTIAALVTVAAGRD